MALTIKKLNSGEHGGISRASDRYCGYEVVVAKSYNKAENGFDYGGISADGAMGAYQTLKFNTKEEAEEFAQEKFGPSNNGQNYGISKGKGANEFGRIPIAGYRKADGGVNSRKLMYISTKKRDELRKLNPMYFDERSVERPADKFYRGFNFED